MNFASLVSLAEKFERVLGYLGSQVQTFEILLWVPPSKARKRRQREEEIDTNEMCGSCGRPEIFNVPVLGYWKH